MKYIVELFTNPLIMVPVCSWFIAQIIKTVLNAVVNRKLSFERLFGDGGMPSGHSATVTAFAVMCGWTFGFGSFQFAFAGIFAIVVMHDAVGVRREAGKQAKSIKQIAETINGMILGENEEIRTEKLKEFVGHTPLQVVFGALLGIIIAIVALIILQIGYPAV